MAIIVSQPQCVKLNTTRFISLWNISLIGARPTHWGNIALCVRNLLSPLQPWYAVIWRIFESHWFDWYYHKCRIHVFSNVRQHCHLTFWLPDHYHYHWSRVGAALNIKKPSYQYRDSHVKDKTVSPIVLSLTWESPYLGKTVFILRRGLGSVCSLCNVAIQGSNHNSLSMFTKRRKYTFPLCPKSIKIVVYGNTHIITC